MKRNPDRRVGAGLCGVVRVCAWFAGAVVFAFAVAPATAQPRANRPPPQFLQKDKPDQAEGRRILDRFRQADLAGAYWLAFDLEVMPRKGATRTLKGQLFGARNDLGPITRLTMAPALDQDGRAVPPVRWLLQNGPQPAAWRSEGAGAPARPVAEADWLQPVAQTDLTPFDLQMPFRYWTDFVFEGLARVRGRLAHSFILYPPPALAAQRPSLFGVRVRLDPEFNAPLQAELLGLGGRTDKSITILELKKIGDRWIPKSVDVRNELTRDKTRFTVTAAALDLTLPAETFVPAALALPPPAVPAAALVRLD